MFKKKQNNLNLQPISKGMYAYTSERAGDFLLFVESLDTCYKFLYLPGADPFYLTLEDFTKAVKAGILEFVEALPEDIYTEALEFSKYSDKNLDLSYRKNA
jgi:hypothetical protein